MKSGPLSDRLLETLALFDGGGAPLTTTEVTGSLDVGRRSTYERLERLVECGQLETKKVGANARVWWRPATPREGTSHAKPAAPDSLVDDVLDDVEVGIFVLDDDFDVVWLNHATERYFDLDREQVIHQDKRQLIDEHITSLVEDAEAFAETVLATYDENTYTEEFECHVTPGENRKERWLEHRSRPIKTGVYAGGRVELYYDVTDRHESERARQKDRDRFESIVETVEEHAIFMLDPDGYVQTWNPGAERIKGYSAAEIVGEHVSTFYSDEDRQAGVPERNLADALDQGSVEAEGWRVRSDGTAFWASVTITAIQDEDGVLEGYANITRDMTDRREREQELRRERDLNDQLFDTAPVRLVVFEADGSIGRMNSRAHRELGIESPTGQVFDVITMVDADGEPLPAAKYPVRTVIETGEPITDLEVEHETLTGERRWVSLTASPLFDEDGAVEQVIVAGKDITERKEKERQLARQRDELRHELEDVFERVDDAFYAVDDEMRFTYVNESAETLLGHTEAELLGRRVWDALSVADDDPIREQFATALTTQNAMQFERYSEPLGIWEAVRVYPSESGLSVYFTDITERKAREQELERYETIVETVWDGVYALDDEDRFVFVNQAFCDIVGYDREDLIGQHPTLVNSEAVNVAANDLEEKIRDGVHDVGVLEYEFETADGETVPVESRFGPYGYSDGRTGRCGVARDITERKERERELEESRSRYRTLIENFPNGAVALVDDTLRYTVVGGTPLEDAGVTMDDLIGKSVDQILPDELADLLVPRYEAALAGEPSSFERTTNGTAYLFRVVPVRDGDGEVFAAMGMSQDISGQKEREHALRDRVRQQEVVADLGQRALDEHDLDGLLAEGAELVADTLENDYCKVLDLDQEAEELLLRQGVGWHDDIVGSATVSAVEADSQVSYTLESDGPVSVSDLDTETRFSGPGLLTNHDVRSGISVIVGPRDDPWGILGTHNTNVKSFSDHDVAFVQSVANILAAAITRAEHEQTLVHQREQLEALNNVNQVVQDITDAVIDQSSRLEIEQTVCDRLAAADSYLFAWVGEVDVATQTVELRTEAGVDGYLDDVTISVNPDDERSDGATGRAIRTGETQTTQDISLDERYDPWREAVDTYGFRSSAAIPIVHEETTYGVLNVYATRPDAFEGPERAVIAQLGEIVGHAIAATERERALLSDEVVELEFHAHDLLADLGIDTTPADPITFDHAIPLGDGEYLVFGTTSPDAIPVVEALTDTSPYWDAVTFEEHGDRRRFELRLVDPPLLRALSAHGGTLEETMIEDGDLHLTLHVPPAGDVRQIIDAVQEAYPRAELLRRQQVSREGDDLHRIQGQLVSELTDRQRTTLETAYRAGFFEWPREASGEEVAELIGVAPPTFSQHLRKAEHKVFETVFTSSNHSTS